MSIINKRFNRRRFIQASSAALIASPFFSSPEIVVKAGTNDALRIGVVGCGGRSGVLLRFLSENPNVRVTALCDPDSHRLANAKKSFPNASDTQDLRKVIESPDVDAIVVATCNHWHALAAVWAMQAGKDVYLEKPLSITFWEGRQIVNAAKKYGKICQIGSQMRTDPEFHPEVKKFLHEDCEIGPLLSVRVNRFFPRFSIGKTEQPLVPPPTVDYNLWLGPAPNVPLYRSNLHYDWHWMWRTGNGETGNWGAHLLDDCRNDVLRDAVKAPRRILSGGGRVGYNDAGESPNSMFVYFDTGAIPVVFCISNVADANNKKYAGSCPGPTSGYVVYGEGGRYEKHWGGAVAFDSNGKKIREFVGTGEYEGAGPHLQNFVDAVKSRDAGLLNAPVEIAFDTSFWYNGANLAYRLAEPYSKEEALKMDDTPRGVLTGAISDLERHLRNQDIEMNADTFKLSQFLEIDYENDSVKGEYEAEAKSLLDIEYREEFAVPRIDL